MVCLCKALAPIPISDNDAIAAVLAVELKCDLLLLLSNVHGVRYGGGTNLKLFPQYGYGSLEKRVLLFMLMEGVPFKILPIKALIYSLRSFFLL
jgi:hypothetical protein